MSTSENWGRVGSWEVGEHDRFRVTVIVTFFNQEQWVDQALDSVQGQTEPSIQLIIADDGSTDGTRERIAAWQAQHEGAGDVVLPPSNGGLPALLNLAIPLIRGEYVMVLNGDDWLDPTRIATQAAALDQLPADTGVVYSDLRVVDVDGVPTGEVLPHASLGRPEGDLLHRLISAPLLGMPCLMFRASILDAIGQWDAGLVADDFDFVIRCAASGIRFGYVQALETNYRQYGTSLTGARGLELADGRITALDKIRGRNGTTNELIDRRVLELAIALHSGGYDRSTTRRRLRRAVRLRPNRRGVRALVESLLGVPPGRLSPSYWKRRKR